MKDNFFFLCTNDLRHKIYSPSLAAPIVRYYFRCGAGLVTSLWRQPVWWSLDRTRITGPAKHTASASLSRREPRSHPPLSTCTKNSEMTRTSTSNTLVTDSCKVIVWCFYLIQKIVKALSVFQLLSFKGNGFILGPLDLDWPKTLQMGCKKRSVTIFFTYHLLLYAPSHTWVTLLVTPCSAYSLRGFSEIGKVLTTLFPFLFKGIDTGIVFGLDWFVNPS